MKLATILEDEQNPHQETLLKCIAEALDAFKKHVIDDHMDIQEILDNGMVEFGDLVDKHKSTGSNGAWLREHDIIIKTLEKMSVKKWEEAFKAKFGTTDLKMIEEINKEGEKKFSADELKFIKWLSGVLINDLNIYDFDPKNEYHLKWWMKSPTKMMIQIPHDQGALITDEKVAKFNLDIPKIQAMFERFGIKGSKRPIHKRIHNTSIYD